MLTLFIMATKRIYPKSVYVILNTENNRVKIGVSEDVEVRIGNLQSGCGCLLKLMWESNKCFNAVNIEKMAHTKLSECRHIGEWFNVDVTRAVAIIKSAIIEIGEIFEQPSERVNIGLYNKLESGIYEKDGKMYNVKYLNGNWDVNIID